MKTLSKIRIPQNLLVEGGALREMALTILLLGHTPRRQGDLVEYVADLSKNQPTFAELLAIHINGGYFEGIKLGIEFANLAAAQQNVPVGVRGATYVDENEVTQNRTWINWFQVNTQEAYRHTSGNPYVIKAVFGNDLLNSTELALIHAQANIAVLEWAEVVARFQSEDYEVI